MQEQTLEQQAQAWLERRDALCKARQAIRLLVDHAQWPQNDSVDPRMLPGPLRGAVLRLIKESTVVNPPKQLLSPPEIETLREHFKQSAGEIEALLDKEQNRSVESEDVMCEQIPSIVLELDPEELILDDDEPSRFVYETTGKVVVLGAEESRTVVGRFGLAYVNVFRATHAGEPISDVFDSSMRTTAFYDSIYLLETDELRSDLEALLGGDLAYGDVLVLHRLELLPAYRGKGIGLKVVQRLIERFAPGADLIVLNIFPLQADGGADLDDEWRLALNLELFPKNVERSSRKLQLYYRQLGLHHLPGTYHVMMKSADLYDELSAEMMRNGR